jgi:hypothetical protein
MAQRRSVSGNRYLWVVPLSHVADRGRPRHITLPGCDLGRPTFADDATAYVPCTGGSLLRLSLPSAKVVSVITVSSFGVFGATALSTVAAAQLRLAERLGLTRKVKTSQAS